MKTITINAYQYDELSDKAKENVQNYYVEKIFHDWWYESTYEDAKQFHLDIKEFDIYRNYCELGFVYDAEKTATAILENAGGQLLGLAKDWLQEINDLFNSYSDYDKYLEWLNEMEYTLDDMEFEDWVFDESGYQDDKESVCDDFLKQLEEYYLIALKYNYEYYQSEEHIRIECEANDYWFDINGKIL